MGEVVGAPRGDVDRDVPEQPHPPAGRIRAERGPLALEANLVGDGARSRVRRPVGDPERVPRDEALQLVDAHPRARLREQPAPAGERGGGLVRRRVLVGRPEGQHLPPGLACGCEPVDEPVRLLAEPAAREGRRMQEYP